MYEEHHLQKALLAREKKKKATRVQLQFEVMLAGKAEPTSSVQSDLEGSMYLPFWHSKKVMDRRKAFFYCQCSLA